MLRCPRCCKAGETAEEIRGSCVDAQTLGCPTAVAVVSGKDILLVCRDELCGKHLSFPAERIVHRAVPVEVSCMRSPCLLMVVNPTAVPAEAPKRGKTKG